MQTFDNDAPLKLSLSQGDLKMEAELPWDSNLDDIMTAFVGCLRGMTFGDWVVKSIRDWCNDQLPNEDEDEDE